MPFTFAHPAAVLPFRKHCPKYLNLPGLIAGSLTPDLGYYVHNWHWSVAGHSFLGCLSFDLPAGLLLTSIFYLFIRPVSRLFPYPHREALAELCPYPCLPNLKAVLTVAFSVMLGAWTHIIWDGFTHANGWCVRQLSPITPPLFELGTYKVTVWQLLQHGSTLIGLAVLVASYLRYLHTRAFPHLEGISLGTKTRLLLWSLILIPPAVQAVSSNLHILSSGLSISHLDEFSYKTIVTYVRSVVPMILLTGVGVSLVEYLLGLFPSKTQPCSSRNESMATGPGTDRVLAATAAEISSGSGVAYGAVDLAQNFRSQNTSTDKVSDVAYAGQARNSEVIGSSGKG